MSTKSNSLHSACQDLMSEQEKLSVMSTNVNRKLTYFIEADTVIEKLGLPSFSIHSESFSHTLDKIDGCIMFLNKKVSSALMCLTTLGPYWGLVVQYQFAACF